MHDEGKPLFQQIAEQIEDEIIDGTLAEGDRAPSTNELASFLHINPATAAKGVGMLVDSGVLYKQRGIGMFVADGARARIRAERRAAFAARFLDPLIVEAARLGIDADDLADLIRHRRIESNQETA